MPVQLDDANVARFQLAIGGLHRVPFRSGSEQEIAAVIDGIFRAVVRARRHRPRRWARAAVVLGSVLVVLGIGLVFVGFATFGYSMYLAAAESFGGRGIPPGIAVGFAVLFAGMVIAVVGEGLKSVGRRATVRR